MWRSARIKEQLTIRANVPKPNVLAQRQVVPCRWRLTLNAIEKGMELIQVFAHLELLAAPRDAQQEKRERHQAGREEKDERACTAQVGAHWRNRYPTPMTVSMPSKVSSTAQIFWRMRLMKVSMVRSVITTSSP